MLKELYESWNSIKLMYRILIALVLGALLGVLIPGLPFLPLLGTLFVGALKALAPFLIFFLVLSAISKATKGLGSKFKLVIMLYITSTIIAAVVSVVLNTIFPITVTLQSAEPLPTDDLVTLLTNLITSLVDNPIESLVNGNYLSILFWAIFGGFIIRKYATEPIKDAARDIADILTKLVTVVISFAPFGIFGLVYNTVSENSIDVFGQYAALICLLVGAMAIVMFITNPLLVYLTTHKNPYPLLFRCLKTSGLSAFFTRSSAANIPVNMRLVEMMNLDLDFCAVSIPLGAAINTCGAAITISTLTLVAAHSVGVEVNIFLALMLCVVSSIAACGASSVASGSLLLVPMACSMFGIGNDVAMNMVAIGFIISVVQDSMETALNSSSDVLFSAAADMRARPDGDFKI